MPTKLKTIDISTSTILRFLMILFLVALFFKIWQLVASLFLAVVIAASIEPTLRWFEKRNIKRVVSVPSLYVLAIAVFFGIFYAILPSLFNEIFILSQDLPEKLANASKKLDSTAFGNIGFLIPAIDDFLINFQTKLGAAVPDVLGFIKKFFGGILSFILIIVFSFYLSLRKNDIENSLLAVTPQRHKEYVRDLVRRIQKKLGRWMQALFVLSTFVGIGTYIMLLLMKVELALTLAILAGFLEFIPFLGPIIAGTLIFALAASQSVALGFLAVGGYTILQQIQVNFVSPVIMSRAVGFNPLYIIIFVLVGAQLAGFWGVIIAIPLAAALRELFRDLNSVKK